MINLALRQRSDVPAIAQHNDTIGNLFDLVQPMRNVDDADFVGLQIPDNIQQPARFRERQTRRRFVHDENTRAR